MKSPSGHLILLLLWPIFSIANQAVSLQKTDLFCPNSRVLFTEYSPPRAFPAEQKNATQIGASQVQNINKTTSIFTGNVLIEQDNFVLHADQVNFDQYSQELNIKQNIRINIPGLYIESELGEMNLKEQSAVFTHNRYSVPNTQFQGRTLSLSVNADKNTVLTDAIFSSCPAEKQDWYLSMSSLELNHQNDTGTSTHASLWFKNVPIFYWPYLSFPTGDARRSGFLMPSFGSSTSRGSELAVPWYWNIAANQDALITPRYMSKRGTQINTLYRYLGSNSQAKLDLEYLAKDTQSQQQRYFIKLNQKVDFTNNSRFELLLNDVSDNQYFTDLGTSIYNKNVINVERKAIFSHRTPIWNSRLSLQSFNTVDDTIAIDNRPYRRLPQLQINGRDRFNYTSNLNWSLETEWVDFAHESRNKTTGQRLDIYPKLIWPISGDAWFMTATSGYRMTQYNVNDPNNPSLQLGQRRLSISSLDTGLLFERNLFKNRVIQTLEPRLFYLHIPYQKQSNIPLFDTKNNNDFSFAQLFRENRFNGIDRIGDANQLTLAISSRFMDIAKGTELASFKIGQVFYNTSQRVNLSGSSISSNTQSDVIAEASGRVDLWSLRATLQWNPKSRQTDKRFYQISYLKENTNIFNLGYRFRRNLSDEKLNLEQSDISFRWPLSSRYALLSRWNYSLTDSQNIDTIFGIEYESCCWSMRLISQSYLDKTSNNTYDNSIRFQLIFKGFGSISDRKANDILKRAIIGYQPE